MSEGENQDVTQEVVQPDPVDTSLETTQQQLDQPVKDKDYNWRELRQQKEAERRRSQELERHNQLLMQELMKMKASTPENKEIDELQKLADDDLLTKSQARKLSMLVAKEAAAQAIRERDEATVEDRLRLKFQDFDQIVNAETIDYLKQTDPEIARSFGANPDPFERLAAAYKYMKRTGVYKESSQLEEREKAQANAVKPRSANAVGQTQGALGQANVFAKGLTSELKNQLWSEMKEAMKAR